MDSNIDTGVEGTQDYPFHNVNRVVSAGVEVYGVMVVDLSDHHSHTPSD